MIQFFEELDSIGTLPLEGLIRIDLAPDSHAAGPKSHLLQADFHIQLTNGFVEVEA